MATNTSPGKPGRPPGSISLTAEKEDSFITLVRGGASLRSAAEVAGIPYRTLLDWLARAEGRSAKRSTPRLRALAKRVRKAEAEATGSAEVRLHEGQPGAWLRTRAANTTEPDHLAEAVTPDPEQIHQLARRLRDVLLLSDPSEIVPPCSNPRCRCVFHRARTSEELDALAAMRAKRDRPWKGES